ncbi:hypothetical protein D3272_09360 [Lichenibacterium ramalinae]|uniref:Transposase n=1 Tax=Lichenibacterium ramalinae TaxID=2316527 RepID=A0A4Q2RDI9_9HYPH|nr:hypothetical protein D3272_09360 [Lichenibacterium ramalinae]
MRVGPLGESERRRRWSDHGKVRIVEESLVPGERASGRVQ